MHPKIDPNVWPRREFAEGALPGPRITLKKKQDDELGLFLLKAERLGLIIFTRIAEISDLGQTFL